ncbi:eukaryotic rRNA processing protein EBP2-domain-containing protein [Xylariales sp. PMI_506]|nr:eukaryotic rRNA processing protein EBP2-domain-containing protein [Xylariales sp. PMI_506]
MVNKGRLKMALAHEKGVDFQKLHQKKVAKAAVKKQAVKGTINGGAKKIDEDGEASDEDDDDVAGGAEIEDEEEEDDSEDDEDELDLGAVDDSSSSESEIEMEAKIERKPKSILRASNATTPKPKAPANDDEDEGEDEDDEDIPMSDLEDLPDDEREDLIPHTRLTINNTTALIASLNRIAIPTGKSVAFVTHQSIVSIEPTADGIEDIQDDLKRELAFYAQSLDAAKRARALLKAEGIPFSRPNDYFAEMVKDDGHMEKIKARLVEEASAKKASAEARKLRDLKKFGKQVQVAKLQERQKAKRDTLEKIKSLKRKRQESSGDVGEKEGDLFDVSVENEIKQHNTQKTFSRGGREGGREGGPNAKRQKKDAKYGFGGKKRYSKSGDAVSSADMSGFSARRMKTGAKAKPAKTARLGKSRRNVGAGKR